MRIAVNGTTLFFDVAGAVLRVDDLALQSKPTIIVLHGGPGFDHAHLRPGLGPLAGDAQVVFLDLRGQGRSARGDLAEWSLEHCADDVAAFCEALHIEQPIVFGHSAGGFVALHLAVRHPRIAGGLILCGTSPTLAPMPSDEPQPSLADRAGPEALAASARLFSGDASPEAIADFVRLVAPFYAGPTHMDVPGTLFPLSPYDAQLGGYFFGVHAARYDLRPRLKEIVAPTLVIVGAYDWVCRPVGARVIAAGIPNARLEVFEGCGHFVFSEDPDGFQSLARDFLRGL
jgi:proline iminopeptidase